MIKGSLLCGVPIVKRFRPKKWPMRMRCVTWPVGRGQKQPKIWKPWPRFAYSLYNFQGATMMIKGSLLCSVPIVRSCDRKFLSPKMGRKFKVFGFLGGEF